MFRSVGWVVGIGGFHLIVVFTNIILPPDDLRLWTVGLFQEGELFSEYDGWTVLKKLSYVLYDFLTSNVDSAIISAF